MLTKSKIFDYLLLMQLNIAQLSKKAVSAALKQDWTEAIKLNSEIIEIDPKNIDAKLRLGRAYLYTKDFVKAKKMFKEVLSLDPINQVALKNIDLINNNKVSLAKDSNVDAKALIKEPGTTTEVEVEVFNKGLKVETLVAGEQFTLKIKKKSVEILHVINKQEAPVAEIIQQDTVNRLNLLMVEKGTCQVSFIKGSGKSMSLLLRASKPVFKSDKQDVRPYIKKGSLDEPDIDNEEIDLTDTM
jgi:tetratricopeptide (TPR) repeat protein